MEHLGRVGQPQDQLCHTVHLPAGEAWHTFLSVAKHSRGREGATAELCKSPNFKGDRSTSLRKFI